MDSLIKDIRYGVRGLLKHPGFTAIVVITLGLGIGASTAIFSVVDNVLLRRLPYRNAERIVAIQELNREGKQGQVTSANFLDWRAQNTVFEHLAAIKITTSNLALSDHAERIDLAQTNANFFDVFGVAPQYGRLFIPQDEQAGHDPVVIMSNSLWQRRFGSDPSLIGKPITLDGTNFTVIGIAPPGFQYPDKTELWAPPLQLVPELYQGQDVTQTRGMGYLSAIALLKPGVSLPQAATEMETITARLRQQYPATNNRRFNRVVSLHQHLIGDTNKVLWLLLGAVTFVLLIGCANVANLLLASGAARQKEMAIRTALGASRWRVMRQLFTESTILALTGGAVGVLIAVWGLAAITKLLPADFPRLNEIHLDLRILAFTFVASVLTGILFGLAPALQISRADVQESIRETGRGTSGSRRQSRFRQALIVAEVALCVVLLAGAGLLFRSFLRLQSVNTGFVSQQVLTARLTPSGPNFTTQANYINFYSKVIEKLSAVPGVIDAGVINTLPLDKGPTTGFRVEGRPIETPDKWPSVNYRDVSPNYFQAMGIPVVQGRAYTDRDNEGAPLVMIINQQTAREIFPGENPVGKRITFGNVEQNGQPRWFEIVGVVANVRSLELREEPQAEIYFSTLQDYWPAMSIVVRSSVEPSSLSGSIRQVVNEIDKSVPVSQVKTMDHIVSESITQPRFNLFLLVLFGTVAMLLSAAGIYGVTAYTVSQRTHELGIRLALGAQVGDVLKMILGQGMAVIGVGLVLGLVAAFGLMRLLRSLLFGVGENDPVTFVAITFVLLIVALIACYIPARRATKVDPLEALRAE
ncbi:MAG TPA: ABC transporter permease [Pyrinomonadaceae bacterium]|jgi:putative ABC transport system permease protein|nr:ABC transporter permease [Pyrinomonadaceae bacterium]